MTPHADESPQAPAAPAADPFEWPTFGLSDDVRPALAAARRAAEPAALATLHHVVGGAPRGVGAQMLVTPTRLAGFLSGGCIEADVALHARAALQDLEPRRLVYGEGGPPDLRLPCGSRIEVLVEAVPPDDEAAARLLDLTERRREALWLTDGRRRQCLDAGTEAGAAPELAAAWAAAESSGEDGGSDRDGRTVFRRYGPRTRLIVFGSEPIALALARLALDMDRETVLVRPLGPAAPPPGPGLAYRTDAPAAALAALEPDAATAVAVLTHDSEAEDDALSAALAWPTGYVGVLGSRRRISARLDRLRRRGFSEEALARIRAPIGLPLGGKSPFEIAVAILAEITHALARPGALAAPSGPSETRGA